MNEDFWRQILDSVEDRIAVVDRDGTIVATNEAWKQFSIENAGLAPKSDVGNNYLEVTRRAAATGDEIAQQALVGIEAVLAGRKAKFELEYPCHSPSAQYWYILRATPLGGASRAVVLSHVDITRRKIAEEARDRLLGQATVERARLDAILHNAANAIIAIDVRTSEVQANWEAERLFGHPFVPTQGRAQYIGQICDSEGQRIPASDLLSSRALEGQTPPRTEVLVVRPDGSRTQCLENAAPILGPGGTIDGAVVVFQDITVLKELERRREEWTTLIAHDMRQPITIITAYAQLLLRPTRLSAERRRSSLEYVARSAERLKRMIADLLDVSRIESRQLTLNKELVDFAALLRQILARLQQTLPGRELRLTVGEANPGLWVDPVRIEQVLTNLVTNADKYGYPDTEIVVELTTAEHEAVISVTNRGPGIPAQELPELFTRFYRTRDAKAGRQEGLGLGLYIAKSLVESHGGRVWVESLPQQTTTFHFSLPFSQDLAIH